MTALLILVLTTYFLLFLFLHRYIDLNPPRAQGVSFDEPLAVVIAMRNEENNIIDCLKSINASEGFEHAIHVILIDDHSEDASVNTVRYNLDAFDKLNVTLLSSTGIGKKSALVEALQSVSESWCYLTDADCQVKPNTISSMAFQCLQEKKNIAFGPVMYHLGSFRNELMAYENMNTQLVGEALLRFGKPAMVNGANLLLHSTAIPAFIAAQNMKYASGDDVFFSQSLEHESYVVVHHAASAVITSAPQSIRSFFSQRLRWASKHSGYSLGFYKYFPIVVFLQNFIFLVLTLLWAFQGFGINQIFVILMCKWLVEWAFHTLWFRKYNAKAGLAHGLFLTLLQPLQITIVGIAAMLNLQYEWKGRNVVNQSIAN